MIAPGALSSRIKTVRDKIPNLLTPGAAESLAVKIYRNSKTENLSPGDALSQALTGYQHPVPADVMNFQIALAAKEATDGDFVPAMFRSQR